MEAYPKELSDKEKDDYLSHLMHIWDITPEDIKDRFKKLAGCYLCNSHREHLINVIDEVKSDREAKKAANEQA